MKVNANNNCHSCHNKYFVCDKPPSLKYANWRVKEKKYIVNNMTVFRQFQARRGLRNCHLKSH